MGKKRFTKHTRLISDSNVMKISEEVTGQTFFEIGNEVTTDVAEAVAIMMRNPRIDSSVWDKQLSFNLDSIAPEKSLYWLSGGDNEWVTLQNYNTPWSRCYLEFQEEFGYMVISIIRKSKSLGDIRDGFIKYLNLPVLYELALSKNLTR